MRILVTGASGFIGSFIVERALALGMEVWAGVRPTSSRRYLGDARLHFANLDLADEEKMRGVFERARDDFGAWDVVVHAAGLTKSRRKSGFVRVNRDGTRNLVNALRGAGAVPSQFIFLSSLSVLGAIREKAVKPHPAPNPLNAPAGAGLERVVYEEMTDGDIPAPNTAYGLSKAAAESFLQTTGSFPWLILRPTGVYGPRERDYYLMAKSIKSHIDFSVGFRPQEITFIYVKDLVAAIFAAISCGATHHIYMLSDGRVYHSRAFSQLLQKAMGVRRVAHVKAPLWLLKAVCAAGEAAASVTGRAATLNLDKYRILKQRNWQCDISRAVADIGFRPEYPLERGVAETVAWYKENNWI